MRVTKAKQSEHREQILIAAARGFREHGYEGLSVAGLMQDAGLTHGGFYGHFASKDELAALASARAMEQTAERWEERIRSGVCDSLQSFAETYLSVRHLHHPETGCLLAACGSEMARQPTAVKETAARGVDRLIDVIAGLVPGRTRAARRKNAVLVFSALVGGLTMARSVGDVGLREEILTGVSGTLGRMFGEG